MNRLLALCALAVTTTGCAGGEPAPEPRRPSRAAPPVVIRPLFAADYVAAAASIDLFEIRSSELALERSTNARIRDFATMMIAAHKGTSAQLSFAGRRLNIVPPAAMLPRHQDLYEALVSAGDFDSVFLAQQLQVHQEALKLHGDFAAKGESPTLRPVAANAAPIVRRHLDQLRAIR